MEEEEEDVMKRKSSRGKLSNHSGFISMRNRVWWRETTNHSVHFHKAESTTKW